MAHSKIFVYLTKDSHILKVHVLLLFVDIKVNGTRVVTGFKILCAPIHYLTENMASKTYIRACSNDLIFMPISLKLGKFT
jgi:hypothetical protein